MESVDMARRSLSENVLLPQTFRYFQKTMLAISIIWLCLFSENASILDKMPILGQAPSPKFHQFYTVSMITKKAIDMPFSQE
jgi:hypothetical protein